MKIVLGCAFLGIVASCDIGSPYTRGVKKTAHAYFRITADDTVIDTGEEINFDYVMVCGGTVTHSTYTNATVTYSLFPDMDDLADQNRRGSGYCNAGFVSDVRLAIC